MKYNKVFLNMTIKWFKKSILDVKKSCKFIYSFYFFKTHCAARTLVDLPCRGGR